MNLLRSFALAAGSYLILACSSSSGVSGADGDPDASAADAGLSASETATMTSGASSFSINEQTTAVANDLFDFDPTIDPTATPATNATAIGSNIQAELGSSCGKVTVSGASVTVSFGSPPGCTLKSGDVVSGSVDLAVTKSGSTTTIALTLSDVVSNGVSMDGTASFATTNGSTFAVTTNLTSGSKTDVASLTVTGSSGTYVISGSSTNTENGTTTGLTFSGLTVTVDQCYANAGSMTVKTGSVTETIAFGASTPSTGEVSVTIGKRTSTSTLPAYGSCPTDGSAHSRDR